MIEDEIRDAFDAVRAEDGLRERTLAAVRARAGREVGAGAGGRRTGRPAWVVTLHRRMAVAACLVVALVALGGWAWLTPTATISVDVNPSVELGINRFDRVVAARGANEDGSALLREVDVWGATYDEAVSRLLGSADVSALLAEGGQAEVTVVDQGDPDQCERLLAGVEACTEGSENTHCHGAREDEVSAAREEGLSYGKYRVLLEIQGLDPSVTADDVRDLSMREMLDLLGSLGGEPSADAGSQGGSATGSGGSGHEGHHGGHW